MDRILALVLVAKIALFASAVGHVHGLDGAGDVQAPEPAEQVVPVQDALVSIDEDFPSEDPRLP